MPEEWILKDSREEGRVFHPSLQGIFAALQELAEESRFTDILDMGCGSGLLSLAAARIWPEAQITAADISALAVKEARENVALAGLQERISVIQSDGYSNPALRNTRFGLILSNILAELHVGFAQEAVAHLKQGGALILGGILSWHADSVRQAYASLGLTLLSEYLSDERWVTMGWQKQG